LAALEVARANAAGLGVAERVHFVHGDLLEPFTQIEFDVIASNPPYVSQVEFDALPDEIKRYEPQSALLAGVTGTEVIARLVPQAASHLRPAGRLFLEISPMVERAVLDLLARETRFGQSKVHTDLAGHARVISACRSA
jgi:release factor glutamine methyltransferase